jgi:hypothetical protein
MLPYIFFDHTSSSPPPPPRVVADNRTFDGGTQMTEDVQLRAEIRTTVEALYTSQCKSFDLVRGHGKELLMEKFIVSSTGLELETFYIENRSHQIPPTPFRVLQYTSCTGPGNGHETAEQGPRQIPFSACLNTLTAPVTVQYTASVSE